MPIAWVDVPDPKNPPAGAPKLSAANLARLALIEDIGTTGTPTGDALKAAYAAVGLGVAGRYSRGASLRQARHLGSDVMATPPTVTVTSGGSGISSGNFDTSIIQFGAFGAALTVSGQIGYLPNTTTNANPTGITPAAVRCLSAGAPRVVSHGSNPTIDAAINPANWSFEIGHYGTKICFALVAYGGGSFGGAFRVKINGQYISLTPTLLKGTGFWFVALDFTALGAATRTIQVETQNCGLAQVQILANDAVWLPPRAATPRAYVVGDSFAVGSNAQDGTGGAFTGLVPQIMRKLGIDDYLVDGIGSTGVLHRNGSNNNFLDRATTTYPLAGTVDSVWIIGSVNDIPETQAAITTQAGALYDLFGATMPIFQVVMPGGSGQSGMATVLAAYQAAAASRPNVHVLDITAALTGTGFARLPAPVQLTPTLATATGPTAGTYYYTWTALYSGTETTVSNEQTVVVGSGQAPTLMVRPVAAATGYNVYRGTTPGGENIKVGSNVTATWTDTGAAGSAATPPASNTTGGPTSLGTNSLLRSADGTHPTQAGHDFYADWTYTALCGLLPGLA